MVLLDSKREKKKFVMRHGGRGILNNILNSGYLKNMHIPFDHDENGRIRSHNFTGPGTDLKRRLVYDSNLNPIGVKNKYLPINKLDLGALYHDIAYLKHKDVESRNIADRELARVSHEILQDPNATRLNAFNAALVNNIMNYKVRNKS